MKDFQAFRSVFYNVFGQDDWKVTPRLKINYGVRYDLYDVPQAPANAPLAFSQNFRIDKNNFAPRFGVVYALREGDHPTVVRGSMGIYYDPPQTDLYRRAIQQITGRSVQTVRLVFLFPRIIVDC